MRLLRKGLQAEGFRITATSLAHTNWTNNAAFLDALGRSHVVVINGEGTLHDASASGGRLLSVLTHAKRGSRPVVLINALWENNPQEWADLLSGCALVSARDLSSAAELTRAGVRGVRHVPDLSLSEAVSLPSEPRSGLIVGDSVRSDARHALGTVTQAVGSLYVPTKTLAHPVIKSRWARSMVWRAYTQCWRGSVPPIRIANDEAEYLRILAGAEGHITGRFHGVCMSFLTETPFIAVSSKTSKVRSLLEDSGLGTDRLLSLADLSHGGALDVPPFTPSELSSIRDFREMARVEAHWLFREIRRLA
jgi:polysaccharide pyruvyl transferase WcaK-like protein